jgi:hypothetical protein
MRLLSENFPHLHLLHLDGYRIRYSKKRRMFSLKIITQIPKILSSIKKERRWLQEEQHRHNFDLIISDNRYGLYLNDVPNIILTHQLQIMSGMGLLADAVLRRLHYRMLNRFNQCWVVDEQAGQGFSGKLGHPDILPGHTFYTGLLSQFSKVNTKPEALQSNRILVLLSGPEPMRGQFEALVLQQIKAMRDYQFVVVGGNPLGKMIDGLPSHMVYHTHLQAKKLLPELQQAALVICRSGYSTVMDLAVCGKRALLVPTPGQTEQEYLAKYLSEKKYFLTCNQKALNLNIQIPEALNSPLVPAPYASGNLLKSLFSAVLKTDSR